MGGNSGGGNQGRGADQGRGDHNNGRGNDQGRGNDNDGRGNDQGHGDNGCGPPVFVTRHGSLDATSTRDGAGPSTEPFWGSGNTTANYDIYLNHDKHIELGLKVHLRGGADIPLQADGTYDVPHGPDPANAARASWNFDYSVNTGVEGSHKTLADFDVKITVSSSDGEVGVFNMQHVGAGNTPFLGPGGGFADEDGSNPQIAQNSVNLGFAFMTAIFGADYANAGEHYTVKLEAFSGAQLVGQVVQHIDVI
ncbi:MAG: hypothetical protein ABIO39_15570 [Caulobacteraceae bacterium]